MISMASDDDKRQKRIHQVARSLKAMHIVSSMEDALARAKDIVSKEDGDGKSIGELMDEQVYKLAKEVESDQNKAHKFVEKTREKLDSSACSESSETTLEKKRLAAARDELDDLHNQLDADTRTHKLEKGDVEASKREVKSISSAADDALDIVDDAKKVQNKDKK